MSYTKRALECYVYSRTDCTPEELAFASGYCFTDWAGAPPCDCPECSGREPWIDQELRRVRDAPTGARTYSLSQAAFHLGRIATPASLENLFARLLAVAAGTGLGKAEIFAVVVPAFQRGMQASVIEPVLETQA